jgi:hypothetical protein
LTSTQIILVGGGWEEEKLHEHPNDYVEVVCDLCALLWRSLSEAKTLPSGCLNLIWENVVEGGYMALLDGFSRVPFCSTEGRALMSMDLVSYSSGMSPRAVAERLEEDEGNTPLPPSVNLSRGTPHVNTYIKVFYFPPKVRSHRLGMLCESV